MTDETAPEAAHITEGPGSGGSVELDPELRARVSFTDLHVLVCGPADHVLINLGPDAEQYEVDGVLAMIVETWPELAGRVLVGSVAQIVVIEG